MVGGTDVYCTCVSCFWPSDPRGVIPCGVIPRGVIPRGLIPRGLVRVESSCMKPAGHCS